jgi:precorrin-6Y C5,15-methyltransferase (decarboxylating)
VKIVVIGITDHPQPFFPPEVLKVIGSGRIFSGGKRHHEIVAPLLPEGSEWIDIIVPLDAVFERYKTINADSIVVFASGDPLFFGFANTIRRKLPEAEMTVYPSFNSLQMLVHRLVMPYHDMRVVSLTGRPWPEFDRALIERTGKIGVLTDREHTPAAIARRMIDYGYTYYNIYVGEHLGNPSLEKVTSLTLEEAAKQQFDYPNCVLLVARCEVNDTKAIRPFGIPDSDFSLLDGREKMITKMPIRLLTLQALELSRRHVFWDIGFCTGSVSIEARLLFPHLHIVAFEIRPECETIICENARRHGAPGIEVIMGDFCSISSDSIALNNPPDAVFIGGHGGRLKDIMAKVYSVLAPGGVIVFNSVTSAVVNQMTDRPTSRQLWDEACAELNLHQEKSLHIQLNDYNPIEILKATKT